MNQVRIGIIGVGAIGSAHLQCLYQHKISGMAVTAVCDTDPLKYAALCTNYPDLHVFRDAQSLLSSPFVDAVLISVPHPMHAQIGIEAFRHHKHVLVEKPADIRVSAARKLNEAAKASGLQFGIMFQQRTNPLFQRAHALVQSGELGRLKRSVWIVTNWYRTQAYYDSGSWRATWKGEGGGVLLNQAPHNLDLWQWICGMPDSVTAFLDVAKYHNIEVEDEATLYTRYADGAIGTFITSTGEFPGTNRLEISGTKGKLVLENGVLKHWRLLQEERQVCRNCAQGLPEIEQEYTEYTAHSESAHRGILQNFADAILYGKELLAPGYEGIAGLTLSNAAYLSQWTGNQTISLPFSEETFDALLAQKAAASNNPPPLPPTADSRTDEKSEYLDRWQVRW